jgi:chromosome segregation ATPase
MQINSLTIFAGSCAAILGFSTYLYANEARRFKVILSEAGERFKSMQAAGKKLTQENKKLQEKMANFVGQKNKLEASLSEFREKLGVAESEKQIKIEEVSELSKTIEKNNEASEKQLKAMTEQLKSLDEERALALKEVDSLKAEIETKISEATLNVQKDLSETRNKLNESNRMFLEQKTMLKGASAKNDSELQESLERSKRKIAQLDRLYTTMKNQKEMAEERNENWTVALDKLAAAVMTNCTNRKLKDEYRVPTNTIGQRVAIALESINESLIEDDFTSNATSRQQPET